MKRLKNVKSKINFKKNIKKLLKVIFVGIGYLLAFICCLIGFIVLWAMLSIFAPPL